MSGLVVLEVVRPITVEQGNDVYDRSIVPYENAFLYAYGGEGSIAYHGSMNRKSTQVTFYTPSSTSTDAIIESKARDNGFVPPADTHGYFDLVVTDYAVPHGSVTYACTSKAIPLPTGGGDRMLVAAEAIIKSDRMGGDNNNGEAFESPVHHFTVYVCGGDSYARKIAKTVACNGGNTGTAGPLANPEAQCSTFVFGCKLIYHVYIHHGSFRNDTHSVINNNNSVIFEAPDKKSYDVHQYIYLSNYNFMVSRI